MPRSCCVLGCKINYYTCAPKVSVFRFPKDEHRRQQWVKAINRTGFIPTPNTVVCAKHFERRFIVTEDRMTRPDGSVITVKRGTLALTKDACPTLFPIHHNYPSKESPPAPTTPTNTQTRKDKVWALKFRDGGSEEQPTHVPGGHLQGKIDQAAEKMKTEVDRNPRITGPLLKQENTALENANDRITLSSVFTFLDCTARVQERLGPDAAPSQSTSTATKDDRSATESKLAKKRTGKKNEAAQGRQKMENKVGVPGGLETKSSYSAGRGGGGRGRSSLPSVSEVPKSELSGVDSVFVWEGPDIRPTQGRETKVPSTIGIDRSKKIGELKASAPLPSTSKTRGSTRKKNKLEREEVEDEEEEEKDTKKLKLEEEDWKEEETDPLELEHFQEIKIEEEDPLSDPYLLDEGASDDGLADIIASVKQEYTSWTDKSNQDNQKVVVAEEDFSQKKITSKQSETKTGIVGEELYTLADKSPEDLTRTTKSVAFKWKDETPQGKSSQEERTAKRRRKVLKENSESDTEFSQHFTKDVYDVFGMHVAKTLRDINNIEVFNRVKIKINDILLDALAGDFSSPGFKIKPSVGTQFPPVGEEVSNTTPPGQSFGRKALSEKNFSAPRKGTHKKAVLVVSPGLDKTQKSSVDHSSSIPQQSRIPVTSHSINQPTTLPVHSSLPETTYTTSVHPLVCTSQHSSIPTTSHVLGQPVTVPVTFIVPGKTQAKTVDPHGTTSNLNRMTETTQCANMIAVLPAASFGLAITPTRSGSIPQSSGVPETTQRSTDATQTNTVDPSGSISQQSEIPVTTQTIPHLHPISSSQSSGVPETTHRSTDATQTSSVDPSGSISQHSETPVPTQTIPNLPHVPGKRKKNLAARNPLES